MSNRSLLWIVMLVVVNFGAGLASGADRLLGVQSARVMSQSMPWIAQETGIFRRYNLEFPLVYIGSSPLATAAMRGGDAQLLVDGALGHARDRGRISLCRVRSRSAPSPGGGLVYHPAFLDRAQLARHRPIHARHGRGRQDLAHGQRSHLQGAGKIPAR